MTTATRLAETRNTQQQQMHEEEQTTRSVMQKPICLVRIAEVHKGIANIAPIVDVLALDLIIQGRQSNKGTDTQAERMKSGTVATAEETLPPLPPLPPLPLLPSLLPLPQKSVQQQEKYGQQQEIVHVPEAAMTTTRPMNKQCDSMRQLWKQVWLEQSKQLQLE